MCAKAVCGSDGQLSRTHSKVAAESPTPITTIKGFIKYSVFLKFISNLFSTSI